MNNRFFALLVHERAHPLGSLHTVLTELSVDTYSVQTCEEARHLVPRTQPDLIFTDTRLPDGTWTDVVDMAGICDPPVNVIVVSATEDVQLYMSALERGGLRFHPTPLRAPRIRFRRALGRRGCPPPEESPSTRPPGLTPLGKCFQEAVSLSRGRRDFSRLRSR
jgi:DNA-binding NtrC family response regulator